MNDDESSMCHKVEGYPGRFPYLCSLRMPGSRKHSCIATLVDSHWIVTAAHCIDPQSENSVGCSPVVYCGIDEVNTTFRAKVRRDAQNADLDFPTTCVRVVQTYHVVDAYIHHGWAHNPELGSDIAMLKLDKKARLEQPRLFRDGMVYGDETKLVAPGWGINKGGDQLCGGQSFVHVNPGTPGQCPQPSTSASVDSLLCFCEVPSTSPRESTSNGKGGSH